MHLVEMMDAISDAIRASKKVRSVSGDMILHVEFRDKSACAISFVTSKLAQLNLAKMMFDGGASQHDIRKTFGSSLGSKYHLICELDAKFRKLRILARCRSGALHVPTIHFRNLQMLRYSTQTEVALYFKQVERVKKQKFDLVNFS